MSVMTASDGHDVIAIELSSSPEVERVFAELERPLATWDAKTLQRALLSRSLGGPTRWACLRLTELLLAGGREVGPIEPEPTTRRHTDLPLPQAEGGLQQLGERARVFARTIAQQALGLKRDELTRVSRLEAAAVRPLAELEHRGMPFDADHWRSLDRAAQHERGELRRELMGLLGRSMAPGLFGTTAEPLDNDQELRRLLQAAGHAVTNVRRDTLAALPVPLGPTLARYRELGKLTNSYGEGFLAHVAGDGRIHATFEQIGASTGRMACHAPNLQSIVADSEHRACFRAPDGHALITADYAACELRILADLSGDPVFAEAFARGEDLHARVATAIFGKPVSKSENPELRERAKAVNFGLAYGMGAQGLARAIGADVEQARALLDRYFKTFPRIRGFLEHSAREAVARGFAATMTGRRLYLDAGASGEDRAQAERIAKNMPIQGTNADITKLALARLWQRLGPRGDAWLVNTVHDEIVVECRQTSADEVRALVIDEMRAAGADVLRQVRLDVDAHVGPTWGG